MRLTHPFHRAIVSVCFTFLLAGLLLLPQTNFAVMAGPLPQQPQPTVTPAPTEVPDPTLPLDLVLQDQRVKYGNRNSQIVFNFRVFNNDPRCVGSGNVAVFTDPESPLTADVASPRTVQPGGNVPVPVTVTIPDAATVGQTYQLRVEVSCQVSTQEEITDSQTVFIVVTINGQLPTTTPVASITPTATGTTGPSPTPGALCRDTFEPDGNLTQAREILPDLPQEHAICPSGDEDFVYFGGIAGKVYTIDVTAMDPGIDLTLSLYDAQGNLLAFNNDFPRNNDATDIKPRIQSWRAPANGTYYVKIRDDAGRGGTDLEYTVELQSESYGPTPTLVAELCTDLFEPDGVPEQARLVVVREVQPNHRFCPAGDADWVRFFAKAGQRYALRVDSNSRAGADPVMVLVDRDGASILDFNDDSNGTLDPRIEFEPAVDGFYFAQMKNVGDIGSQFISYDFLFEPLGTAGSVTATPTGPTPTSTDTNQTPTTTGTPGTETPTTDTTTTTSPTATIATFFDENGNPYPAPTQTVLARATLTAIAEQTGTPTTGNSLTGVKGAPTFVNGPAKDFVDPALKRVWERTDQVVAARQVDRSWMWGPSGLVARAEVYTQSNGGARQVQYFDKARMEITDWSRDRSNPWFVTNGLLVKELIEGRLQIGDADFLSRPVANINVAGDADDSQGPTYASFARHMGGVGNRVGQTATATLRRDGSTDTTAERAEARLAAFVPETGHNIPQVFWDFLNARGPVGDGKQSDVLVDWVFAMGYPLSEPFWTKVKVGGVEKDVLVQSFQRRVLTYTPSNPAGWQVEMGNVGRHYYQWRYARLP